MKVAEAVLRARLMGVRVPLFVGAAITGRCDGQCVYCRRSGERPDDLDTDTWLGLIRSMAEAGTMRVSFTGGEPLMRPDVGRLLWEARSLGLNVNINTNGTRLASRIDEVILADSITVSFDGPRDVMDRLRGSGTHERVVAGIVAARSAGVPVMLHATVTAVNVDRVDEILAEARRLGVRVGFSPVREVPLGPGGDRSLLPRPGQMRRAVDRLIRRKALGSRAIINSFSCLEHLSSWPSPTPMRCTAGRIYARLEHDGRLFGCGDDVLGEGWASAVDLGFSEAFGSLRSCGCDECWCDTRIEMNLLFDLDAIAALEAFSR
jgi:MoaA/NifB/PqqE/SkfB family radical SAM enzyme